MLRWTCLQSLNSKTENFLIKVTKTASTSQLVANISVLLLLFFGSVRATETQKKKKTTKFILFLTLVFVHLETAVNKPA